MERLVRREKSIAILQSNYIPWKGYFDLIAAVDEFLIFDEVQYTRRDWRNRNKIVLQGSVKWLTIPVRTKGHLFGSIEEIETDGHGWAEQHWKTITHAYRRAAYFGNYEAVLEAAFQRAASLVRLTDINELFLRTITGLLHIETPIARANVVPRTMQLPTDRLVEICLGRQATEYVSGPAGRAYIEVEKFGDAQVALSYANYSGYPVYEQHANAFEHGVSILDVLMRCGPAARGHLKSPSQRDSFVNAA
ncbi:MAG TPA: WbqC family protein [Beijerinckiaceae bacterium]|jgi:hypothetical protein|nr:WbqC family protein [Beijerinckiaceae bacterium]